MYSSDGVVFALKEIENPEIATQSARFFKTGPGEYGEGDQFLGVRVPKQRAIAKEYRELSLEQIQELLQSPWHEVRLTALLILVYKYQKLTSVKDRKKIFRFYILHSDRVNNWDLVDSTAKYISGHFLYEYSRDRSVLYELSDSESLWKRRIAIMSTFYFIDKSDFDMTLELAEKFLTDTEDLIHKATGWMLREIGKKDEALLREFLDRFHQKMPRTMLRYAIEKLHQPIRSKHLKRNKKI